MLDDFGARSACQGNQVSCGACCGIYNLKLKPADRHQLLLKRTLRFSKVQPDIAAQMAAYRQESEQDEVEIARAEKETYVCPFLGYLEDECLPGCMAHPLRTGSPITQNFSFYGASICQTYNCRTKELDVAQHFNHLLELIYPGDSDRYGRLMADHYLYLALEKLLDLVELSDRLQDSPEMQAALQFILESRLLCESSKHVTSFEFILESIEAGLPLLMFLLHGVQGKLEEQSRRNINEPEIRKALAILIRP